MSGCLQELVGEEGKMISYDALCIPFVSEVL